MIRPFPNKNWREFQNFHIRPRSAVDSAQWDWGISWAYKVKIINHYQSPWPETGRQM